ncbi:pyocin knob domain-containing protein [Phocaeicola sp.]
MDDKKYESKYDGDTTDDILGYANEGKTEKVNEYVKSMNVQDSKGEPDTVQVYDTDGVPHKISKTELLKKSTLALPALEDISSFVAVNAAGNAVGVMTKEQVASVLAELMGGFIRRSQVSESFDSCINQGVYTINKSTFPSAINYPPGMVYGLLIVFSSANGWISQFAHNLENNTIHTRIRNEGGSWTEWKQL